MMKFLLPLLLTVFLFACKSKKKSLADSDTVEIGDFIAFFDDVQLPFTMADSNLLRKTSDSLKIGYKTFTKFIPDSVFNGSFSKGTKPAIYPLGKVAIKRNETYLFIKAIAAGKTIAYVLAFDKENAFVAALPLVTTSKSTAGQQTATMDTRYTITKNKQRQAAGGTLVYTKDAYIFNSAGTFTLIMTESNDQRTTSDNIINPIDTLPAKHKLAGDYTQDKKNFVSVRDGKNSSHILFFIHFEKAGGTCKGELKGDARLISPTLARYNERGSPCEIELSFSGSRVTVKEIGGCGSYRDIKCFFEGSFVKKRAAKNKKK